MNFVLQTPSLQHLTGVKILCHVWNHGEILAQIVRAFRPPIFKVPEEQWMAIEDEVKTKVSALPLPERCLKPLFNLIKSLGKEMETWCQCHCVNKYIFMENLILNHQLCWSMHGTIDYAKSAELMVKDERLGVEKCYEIACLNCLEDEARELFDSMGEERRRKFVQKMSVHGDVMKPNDMIAYFTYTFCGDVDGLNQYFQTNFCESTNSTLFRESLLSGNRARCEYFFSKLSRQDQKRFFDEHLYQTFHPHVYSARTMLYYFSVLNEDRQSRMFEKCTAFVLQFLLGWPMQSLFMETARSRWQFLCSYGDCSAVLYLIICKIRDGFRDYDYSQMFWECWLLTPAQYCQQILYSDWFAECLLRTKREEFIKLLLNEAPWRQLRELVDNRCLYGIMREQLLDENVISEAALTECKQTAAWESSKDRDNTEKRLRSKYLSRIVDLVIKYRIKNREKSSTGKMCRFCFF